MGPETKKNLKQMEVYNFLAISIIGFFSFKQVQNHDGMLED